MDTKRLVNQRLLRCGFTTGSCAAAAAKAAALALITRSQPARVTIALPSGDKLALDVADCVCYDDFVRCAVIKDSGDDPDITNGAYIYAKVSRADSGITIIGGSGIGRVTLPGLDRPVGDFAINTVPRKMIEQELTALLNEHEQLGGLNVELSIPGGEELAQKTFNPRMGIVGGLSILGTTGIVEPMSSKALSDSIKLELSQLAADGQRNVILTPGNYGEDFCRKALHLEGSLVKCSNFLGDSIAAAVELGFSRILLVGHIGKLSKVGLGIMNTHSSVGDGRMECLSACALEAGGSAKLSRAILSCVSADAALDLLRDAELISDTMLALGGRIGHYLSLHVPEGTEIDFLCFTNSPAPAILCSSRGCEEITATWR